MKVDSLHDLAALLQVLRENGVSAYETPELKLCLGQKPAAPGEAEAWDDIDKRLKSEEERREKEEWELQFAHTGEGAPERGFNSGGGEA